MENESAIQKTVTDIFVGTDERDWQRVKRAFADQVLLDYTSMAGGEPATLSPGQIVTSWQAVLLGFDRTHHQLGNFVVSLSGNEATAVCYGTATHYLPQPDGRNVWTVVGSYDFHLMHRNNQWKADRMRFNLKYQDGNIDLPKQATERVKQQLDKPAASGKPTDNRQVVENFYVALETENFDLLNDVFAQNGRQLNPYVPEGFPRSFDGRAAIYKQYSGLTAQFSSMKFPRTIYATDDPDFFFVRSTGTIVLRAGGTYENEYIGTFRLENGQVTEYTEYFNPIVMAKAFGIPLK